MSNASYIVSCKMSSYIARLVVQLANLLKCNFWSYARTFALADQSKRPYILCSYPYIGKRGKRPLLMTLQASGQETFADDASGIRARDLC
jgi:hypothetical protein